MDDIEDHGDRRPSGEEVLADFVAFCRARRLSESSLGSVERYILDWCEDPNPNAITALLANPGRVQGHEVWSAENPPTEQNRTINLLKLHGSLNWRPLPEDDGATIRLRERPYKQKGDKEYELVPPENSKQLDGRPVLQKLWGNAERAIRRAEIIALVGFSFTPTDLHVDSLFRVALAGNKRLRLVVIVNPDPDHRRSIRAVFATQLARDIRLVQFDRLSQFSPHINEVLNTYV